MTSVFCFLLSALSLTWVLVVISPQTFRPLMLLIGVWAIVRARPTRGRWGPAIDAAWLLLAIPALLWPIANGEPFWYRAAMTAELDVTHLSPEDAVVYIVRLL